MSIQSVFEAIKTQQHDQLKALLAADPSLAIAPTGRGISVLQFAAYYRNTTAIELLKPLLPSLSLFDAVTIDDTDVVLKQLEEQPELLEAYSPDGFTPLSLAVYFGHFFLAKALIEKGANTNAPAKNPSKVTPLHAACASSNMDMVTLLLQNGADVHAEQDQGITALHSAVHNKHLPLVKLLVEHGADSHKKNAAGQSPMDLAKEGDVEEIVQLLS